MDIQESYVFYDEDGNLWKVEFGSCDNALNPTSMWAGTAQIIKIDE